MYDFMDFHEILEWGGCDVSADYESNELQILRQSYSISSRQSCPDRDAMTIYIMVDVCENAQENEV